MKRSSKKNIKRMAASTAVLAVLTANAVTPIMVSALGPFDLSSPVILKPINDYDITLAPGIVEKRYTYEDTAGKRMETFVVEVDTKNPKLSIEAGTPNDGAVYGFQTVRAQANAVIANGEQVVAAINADFYNMATGEPIGVLVKDGVTIKPASMGHRFFGILKDGSPIIGDTNKYNEVKDNLEEALGGNAILVKDGQVFETPTTGADREPRSSAGIKADGKVFFLTVDGRQEPYSAGISMPDLAKLMISMGAVQAINLDGGGSSTYVSRVPGTDNLEAQNKPSDRSERSVANTWLVVSKETIDHKFASAFIEPFDKSFTPDSTIRFSAKGMDAAGASAGLPTSGLTWSMTDSSFGTFDASTGIFTSNGKQGQFEIVLNHNGTAVGKTFVEVAMPDELYFSTNQLTFAKKEEKSIGLVTRFKERDVKFKAQDIIWEMPEGMGTIDDNGIFHAGDNSVSGKVKATLKGTNLTAEIDLTVGQLPQIVGDFENDLGAWRITTANRGEAGSLALTTYPVEPTRFGEHSLKIMYDFTSAQRGTTLGVYAGPGANIAIPGKPTSIGMWIYATPEAKGYWLRMGIVDGNNKLQSINLTQENPGVDWTGWKYIEAAIPETFAAPFSLHSAQTIRIMSTRSGTVGPMTKGALYVDNIRAVYGDKIDDLYAPVIESINVEGKAYTNNSITIRSILHEYEEDKYKTGINWSRVRVLVDGIDYTGKVGHFSYDMDGSVSLSGYKWADGTHKVDIIAQDNFGNEAIKTAYFTVNTGSTKVELEKGNDSAILGSDYKMNISTNNSKNIKAVNTRIKLSKDFPVRNVNFTSSASESNFSYDNSTGILTLNIVNNSATSATGKLAEISVAIPNNIKEGNSLSYEIIDSTVQYADVSDTSFISTFSSMPESVGVVGAFNIKIESSMVGKDGVVKVLDRNSKAASGVNLYLELADGTSTLLGQTNEEGFVSSAAMTDVVKKYNIYAEKEGLYSFKVAIQSYAALETVEPSNILLGTNADPTKEQSISWMSNALLAKPEAIVKYAKKNEYEANGEGAWNTLKGGYKELVFNGELDLTKNGIARVNNATLTNLEPGTAYLYKVGDGENWSEIDDFTTQFGKDESSFVIFGDTQSANMEGLADFEKILGEIETLEKMPDFAVHVGDFVDEASKFVQWDNMLSTIGKYNSFNSVDMINILGNHEYMGDLSGDIAETIFNTPKNGLAENEGGVYSTDYNNMHIGVISFTSDKTLLEKELEWLKKDMQSSNKQWKILITHQPPYYTNPLGGNDTIKAMLPSVVDEIGIDLVLSGHDHAYGRTKKLKAGQESKEGTVYVVTGTTGQKHYDAVNDGSFEVYNDDKVAMYLTASVNKGSLKITTKTVDGTIVDEFTLDKEKPIIKGEEITNLDLEASFDPMHGISAVDNIDGDITSKIELSGDIDTSMPGEYSLTYTAADDAGNIASFVRTVKVGAVKQIEKIATLSDNTYIAEVTSVDIAENGTTVINLGIPKEAESVKIVLPNGADLKGSGILKFNLNEQIIEIPLSAFEGLVQDSNAVVTLEVREDINSNKDNKLKGVGKIYSFSIKVNKHPIHDFANDIKAKVTINLEASQLKDLDTSKLTAMYYNEDTKQWENIGGIFNIESKSFVFETERFSEYTIAEFTKKKN